MFKCLKRLLLPAMMLATTSGIAGTEYLLSGNKQSNVFPASIKRIPTAATLSWVKDGQYGSSKAMISTGSRPKGKCRVLLDGSIGPRGDNMAFGQWGGNKYATFLIDLNDKYLINRITLWAMSSKQQKADSFEVLLSNDGKKFISSGSQSIDNSLGQNKKYPPLKTDYELQKPAVARYVKVRVKKKVGARQLVLAECAVWGTRPPAGMGTELLPENQRPEVKFNVIGIQSGAVALDWKKFASDVSQVRVWKIYTSDKPFKKVTDSGVELKEKLPTKITRKVIYPLVPGQKYFFGITAQYENGEYPVVKCAEYIPPEAFTCKTFGDMLAINHFWGGGGARKFHRAHEEEWEQVAMDILGKTPVKQIRWWLGNPWVVQKMYEQNIGLCTFPRKTTYEEGKKMGFYSYSAGNEPDLSGKPIELYYNSLKKLYKMAKEYSPHNMVSAPTSGLEDTCIAWLDRLYQLGAKDYFDVMDLHTYTKLSKDFDAPAGYPRAAPESLFARLKKVKAVMKKYNDEDKPLISTEFGYSDTKVANPSGNITPKRKAQWLTRGLIIHYVLGFKRVYIYAFFDEGENKDYTEHTFGMVDYYGQKKPAYYAFCTLGKQLGDKILASPVPGIKRSHYGYQFKKPDFDEYTAVIWDGTGNFGGVFKTSPGTVTVTDMMGKQRELKTTQEGTFKLKFGPSPVYICTDAPIELKKSVKVKGGSAVAGKLTVEPVAKVFVSGPNQKSTQIEAKVNNSTKETVNATANLETPDGKLLASQKLMIAPGSLKQIQFPLPKSSMALDKYRIEMSYSNRYSTFSETADIFVRRLAANNGKVNIFKAKMYGYAKSVYIISNDQLEISIDPERGGRVLEFYDKKSGSNQLEISYKYLGKLTSIPFRYCIWDRVQTLRGYGINRNDPYQVKSVNDGVELSAKSKKGVGIVKKYTLEDSSLKLDIKMINNSGKELPMTYYMHPEYTVGGVGDNVTDVLEIPVNGKTIKIPFWSGLGSKKTAELDQGWWVVEDTISHMTLKQEFSLKQFAQPRVWFGIGCYNFEMNSTKGLKLKNGESWSGTLTWQLVHNK